MVAVSRRHKGQWILSLSSGLMLRILSALIAWDARMVTTRPKAVFMLSRCKAAMMRNRRWRGSNCPTADDRESSSIEIALLFVITGKLANGRKKSAWGLLRKRKGESGEKTIAYEWKQDPPCVCSAAPIKMRERINQKGESADVENQMTFGVACTHADKGKFIAEMPRERIATVQKGRGSY